VKKKIITLTLACSLFFAVAAGIQLTEVAANPHVPAHDPILAVSSPVRNGTYQSNVLLNGTLYLFNMNLRIDANSGNPLPPGTSWWEGDSWETVLWLKYSLDGQEDVSINMSMQSEPSHPNEYTAVPIISGNGNFVLSGLSNGVHSLLIQGLTHYPYSNSFNASVYFSVDSVSPLISVLPIENKNYESGNVPLNFNINEPSSWMGFSLDNQVNATITGNTTLTGLTLGSHSLRVYANDTVGNVGASDAFDFIVGKETESQQSDPSNATLIVAISVSAVTLVAVGLLVHLRRRK
jgi:hypothetical protein